MHSISARVYPPYGKQLNDLRQIGLVPSQRIIVTTDWKLGAAYPRIVIPAGAQIEQLIFNYLAGLCVQIVSHNGEGDLVSSLIIEILKVKPKVLTLFNFDIAQQKNPKYSAITLLHPTLEIIQNDL